MPHWKLSYLNNFATGGRSLLGATIRSAVRAHILVVLQHRTSRSSAQNRVAGQGSKQLCVRRLSSAKEALSASPAIFDTLTIRRESPARAAPRVPASAPPWHERSRGKHWRPRLKGSRGWG